MISLLSSRGDFGRFMQNYIAWNFRRSKGRSQPMGCLRRITPISGTRRHRRGVARGQCLEAAANENKEVLV